MELTHENLPNGAMRVTCPGGGVRIGERVYAEAVLPEASLGRARPSAYRSVQEDAAERRKQQQEHTA